MAIITLKSGQWRYHSTVVIIETTSATEGTMIGGATCSGGLVCTEKSPIPVGTRVRLPNWDSVYVPGKRGWMESTKVRYNGGRKITLKTLRKLSPVLDWWVASATVDLAGNTLIQVNSLERLAGA